MRQFIGMLVAVVLGATQLTAPSYANPNGSHGPYLTMRGGYTAPVGFQIFCLNNPGQCTGGGSSKVALTDGLQAVLQSVNSAVNRGIRAAPERLDTWSLNVSRGDCEDFVLAKRQRLIAAGIPGAALRIAIAITPRGVGHAVLVVHTDIGDLVLDSLTPAIKPWAQTNLRWVAMSGSNPRNWYAIA